MTTALPEQGVNTSTSVIQKAGVTESSHQFADRPTPTLKNAAAFPQATGQDFTNL